MPRSPRSSVRSGRRPAPPPPVGLLLALPAALAPGCRSAPSTPAEAETASAPGADPAVEAIEHLQEGRYREARADLEDLLLASARTRARAALAEGDPERALKAVDEALDLAPEDGEVRLLKADASLRLAERTIAKGGSGMLIEGVLSDALAYYRKAGDTPHALFGASRAAWLLGDADEALALARQGRDRLGPEERTFPELGLAPQRILAEPVYAAYTRARADGPAPELFAESEDALEALIARGVDDPWGWTRLADLYEWERRPADARAVLERALARLPEDAGLLARWGRMLIATDGSAAAVRALEARVARTPDLVVARWPLALARFQAALDATKAEPRVLDPGGFQRAEAEFARCGELDPAYASEALKYEVVCRLARGWCALWDERLEDARREFLSMNELFEGGILWSYPGEFEDGIRGLFFVADAFSARPDDLEAGTTFETLLAIQPDNALWANNAGYFLREAAVELEREGRNLCEAAAGRVADPEALARLRGLAGLGAPGDDPATDHFALVEAAAGRFERARAVMERCLAAYEIGATLAPDDVRIVNDLALILIYYLHRDLERAETLLQHGVEVGREQVRAAEAELAAAPEDRKAELGTRLFDLRSAWGDCHENLGMLRYVYEHDGAAALPWLEKAVEIGPARPPLTAGLLPILRGEAAPDDRWNLTAWGTPCDER